MHEYALKRARPPSGRARFWLWGALSGKTPVLPSNARETGVLQGLGGAGS